DTGGFRYLGTSPETMRLGAELIEAGADPWETAYNLFEGWEPERMRLLGAVLGGTEPMLDRRLAVLVVTRRMLEPVGADDEMAEGMVSYGGRRRGVGSAALGWEVASEDGRRTRGSLRSGGRADVAAIGKARRGGGHRAAAGATLREPLDAARRRVVELAQRA